MSSPGIGSRRTQEGQILTLRSDRSVFARLLLVVLGLALVAAACSDDDEGGADGGSGSGGTDGVRELVDVGTFPAGAPANLDPALNSNVETYSVVNALYDGLTDVETSDDGETEVYPLVAEAWESNDDATEWVFTIRDGVAFSDGEEVLPSSFVRGWERASDPELAGPYASLFALVEGGQARLDGEADELSGVIADDEEMTLTVRLAEPYGDFPIVAGFQAFSPMPSAVEELSDQSRWDQGEMIGNGPFQLVRRSDTEIVIERNENWAGDFRGTDEPELDRIVFRISGDAVSAFASFEAGEALVGPLPRAQAQQAAEEYGTTLDVELLNSYHFQINWEDPVLGGPENVELRRAMSLAINRDEINEVAYNGTQAVASGLVPPAIPGATDDLCDHCRYDPDAARAAFTAWQDAGNSLDGPITLQVNAGSDHEPALQVMVDNLAAVGIDARFEAVPQESYGELLGTGGCQVCRFNWVADYPTYDNFLQPMFTSGSIGGGPNFGRYSNPEFDRLVAEAIATVDGDDRAELFREAESILVNDDIGVLPIFQSRGNLVFDEDRVDGFVQTPFGLVLWERVSLVQG